MTKSTGLAALAATASLLLPLSAVAAQRPSPDQPGRSLPLEFAAKFVCGESVTPGAHTSLAALGRYYTAVNILNPNRQNTLTYRVVWAHQGIAHPNAISNFQPNMDLTLHQALDIDCRVILTRLQQDGINPEPTGFFTGFVIIRSSAPLDVVAVYTAAPSTTGQVVSFHTERVPMRQLRN